MRGFVICVAMAGSLAVLGASGCGDDKGGGDESTGVTVTMNATDGNTMSDSSTSEPTTTGPTTGTGDEEGTTTGGPMTTMASDSTTTAPTTMTTDDTTTDTGVDPDFDAKCKASYADSYAGLEKYCPCAVEAGDAPDVETCLGSADPASYGDCACPIYAKYPAEQASVLCGGAAAADFAACTAAAADCMAVGQCLSDFLSAAFDCPETSQEVSDEVDLACPG